MKTNFALVRLLAAASISSLFGAHAHAAEAEQAQGASQLEVKAASPTEQFVEMLQNDQALGEEHVFSHDEQTRETAMNHLELLKQRFQQSVKQKIVATKEIGDFAYSVIQFADENGRSQQAATMWMFQDKDGWKFISESNFQADACRRMFDRRQLGAFWTLLIWAQEQQIETPGSQKSPVLELSHFRG